MRIESSNLSMQAKSFSSQQKRVEEKLEIHLEKRPLPQNPSINTQECKSCKKQEEDNPLTPKQRLIKDILERVWGVKVRSPKKHRSDASSLKSSPNSSFSLNWNYRKEEFQSKEQYMEFSSQGSIKTQDGREISFSMDFMLQSRFQSHSITEFASRNPKDPLTFNFDGPSAELSDFNFNLDIDRDGTVESLPFAPSGAGIIWLDKNHDGKVTDGSEIFGAETGDGFQELAEYDSDGNGWIDENDPVFLELQVWEKDIAGNDMHSSLLEKKVGAISLQSVKSSFDMDSPSGETLGRIQRTGMYLREDGTPGIVQQIDLFA